MSNAPALGATYRLQLHKDFTFDDARELVPYLHRLGVSHVYSSPILKARPGSTHGYDVADPTMANPELGGEEARVKWARAISDAGLGLLLDIVPNHMGTGSANPFWEDVLTHGAASRHGRWFDIRWSSAAQPLRGRVLVPVLGDKLPKVIERNELTVVLDEGRLRLHYFENDFPLDPATWPVVLDRASGSRGGQGERAAPRPADIERLREVSDALKALPRRTAAHAEVRSAAAAEAVGELASLLKRSPALRRRIETITETFGRGAKGQERMRALVERQAYRLAFWRRAARLINYRRFFDINELVALRMERDEVFTAVHERVLDWVERGEVHGLRVDHIDGLLDPRAYLDRLRGEANARSGESGDGFPIFVEKILTAGERLREEWPVQGTTGYEFLNDLESVFVDPAGAATIASWYQSLHPGTRREPLGDFEDVAMRGKMRILTGSLAPDVRGLAAMLLPIARRDARVRASGTARLAKALTEWIACFPVYRTYIDPRTPAPAPADRAVVERVARLAGKRGRIAPQVIDFLRDVMLKPGRDEDREERLRFVAKLQQATGPAMAKGVEDTALYQYVPLASLNEVGGDPARPLDAAVNRFHEGNAARARDWPRNLLCTNTHDTKRAADVRARLDVLAEIPDLWMAAVTRWRSMNAPHRGRGRDALDANSEYLLYQTLLGIWPLDPARRAAVPNGTAIAALRERVGEYMLKAVREAKIHSSWTDPNEAFESALKEFIDAILPSSGAARSPFLRDLAAVASRVGRSGLWNSLSRIVLHMTAPGVPDLYRGDELWNFTLVDPDNRRPVDFERRSALLAEIGERYDASASSRRALLAEIVATPEDDRAKLLVTWRALQGRRARGELFTRGNYEPLAVVGDRAHHVVAFARRLGRRASITIASRLTYAISGNDRPPVGADVWGHSHVVVPKELGARWRCTIAGEEVLGEERSEGVVLELSAALSHLPMAVLDDAAAS